MSLRLFGWLVMLTAVMAWVVPSRAAQEQQTLTPTACGECHDEAAEFVAGPHGRLMGPEALERSCVACHEPASGHMDDPTTDNVRLHPEPEACAACHGESQGQLFLAAPGHLRQGVTCLECHASGHPQSGRYGRLDSVDSGVEFLLAQRPSSLCGGCHGVEASAFQRPYAHREGHEPLACTECHSSHGTRRSARLNLLGNGGSCVDCHSEAAGPFLFPHPPRQVEGCTGCHEPHGSGNPRLLSRRRIFNLCLECHADTPGFHDLAQARFRACSSCHVAVHGSNREPLLFDH